MTQYLIYRKGSNTANQPYDFDEPIAIVRAQSRSKAESTTWGKEKPNVHGCPTLAAEVVVSAGNLDVWSNQHLRAVPESRAKSADWNYVLERAAEQQSV